MPTIEVDFDTYKKLVNLRSSESVSEGDVIRELLCSSKEGGRVSPAAVPTHWVHKGIKFTIGLELEHHFRGSRPPARAVIVAEGIEFNGQVYRDLSPAGFVAAGYSVNGWDFWNYKTNDGHWMPVRSMRK